MSSLCLARSPSTLPPTMQVELTMLSGDEQGLIVDDIWYVPFKNYRLSKVKMWKNVQYTSGFEVTFSPPSTYTDWPDLTHMFGFTDLIDEYSEITIASDIIKVSVCVDNSNLSTFSDFEGIEFTETDGTLTRISPSCNVWYDF